MTLKMKNRSVYIKDLKTRLNYKYNELERLKYLILKNNMILPLNIRIQANDKLSKLGSRSIIRNRCIKTSRSRGIITKYGLSRIQFKYLADRGLIPGIRKAS